jgi:hypothetical protein
MCGEYRARRNGWRRASGWLHPLGSTRPPTGVGDNEAWNLLSTRPSSLSNVEIGMGLRTFFIPTSDGRAVTGGAFGAEGTFWHISRGVHRVARRRDTSFATGRSIAGSSSSRVVTPPLGSWFTDSRVKNLHRGREPASPLSPPFNLST